MFFSNTQPNRSSLSKDRWQIRIPTNDGLKKPKSPRAEAGEFIRKTQENIKRLQENKKPSKGLYKDEFDCRELHMEGDENL